MDLDVVIPLVSLLNQTGDYAEAEEVLRRTARWNPTQPALVRLQLQNELLRGHIEAGRRCLEQLLNIAPDDENALLLQVTLEIQRGRYRRAEQWLQRLINGSAPSDAVWRTWAELLVWEGRAEEALQRADAQVRQRGDASAYLLRGYIQALAGHIAAAQADYVKACELAPGEVRVWLARSDFHHAVGQDEQALKAMNQAVALQPEDLTVGRKQIRLLLSLPQSRYWMQARRRLKELSQRYPDDPDLKLLQVRYWLREGTRPALTEAVKTLERFTQTYTYRSDAWVLLAEIRQRQGEYGKAIDDILRGLTYLPADRDLLLEKARLEGGHTPTLAIPTLQELHKQFPRDLEVVQDLARAYLAAEQPDQAITLLTEVLEETPGRGRRVVRRLLAAARFQQGHQEQALSELDSLLAEDPTDRETLRITAGLLIQQGSWEELGRRLSQWSEKNKMSGVLTRVAEMLAGRNEPQARKLAEHLLRALVEKDDHNAAAWHNLALLLARGGRTAEALDCYRRLLKVRPDDYVALNNYAWMLCEVQGQAREALVPADRAVKLAPPGYLDIYDTRGMIHYRLGDYPAAAADFRKCLDLYPERRPARAQAAYHLGLALLRLGQAEQARGYFRQALQQHQQTGGLSKTELEDARQNYRKLEPQAAGNAAQPLSGGDGTT